MIVEFLQTLDDSQIVGGLTLLSLLVGAIIMISGVITARIARMIFTKYYAAGLPVDTSKNFGKLIYFGIIIISFLIFTTSQGLDLSGLIVAGGIFAVVIGFATQSVVSNLISGAFLMVEKPARQGDTIEIPDIGVSGVLLDINTFSSRIRKFDGTVIRVPNEKFFTSHIRTLTSSPVRRAKATVGISYESDIEQAISVIKKEIARVMPFVLQSPEPEFRIEELGDSSVNIVIFVWHPKEDWGQVQPYLLKVIKHALDAAKIEIPFPQRVIWRGENL